MAGSAGNFFSGLLGGVSDGVQAKLQQKQADERTKTSALTNLYLKGIESGDIEPQHGFPLIANLLSGSFSALTGDKKGSGKDKNQFKEILGSPDKLSGLLLGIHQATNSKPATGPAGPTGLPSAGPTSTGQAQGSGDQDQPQGGSGAQDYGYGPRWSEETQSYSGPPKGLGFLGPLIRPDSPLGKPTTESEFSRDGEIDGKPVQYPLFVPTLSKQEVQLLLTAKDDQKIPESIERKAEQHARERISAGKSPFAEQGEQQNLYPELTRVWPKGTSAGSGSASLQGRQTASSPSIPQTSIFNSGATGDAKKLDLFKKENKIRTDDEIRRYEATTGKVGAKRPTGEIGTETSKYLADIGESWETAGPEERTEALRSASQAVAQNRIKKEKDAKAKIPLRDDEKRGARIADAAGKEWASLTDSERATYTTLGARELQKENETKIKQSTARTSASLARSYAAIANDTERLAQLKQDAPLTLASKKLGIEIQQKRLAAVQSKDPTAVLEQARRQAHAVTAQAERARSTISKFLGTDAPESEDALVDQYIQEWTGQDPATVRANAAARNTRPPSAAPPSPSANPFR